MCCSDESESVAGTDNLPKSVAETDQKSVAGTDGSSKSVAETNQKVSQRRIIFKKVSRRRIKKVSRGRIDFDFACCVWLCDAELVGMMLTAGRCDKSNKPPILVAGSV